MQLAKSPSQLQGSLTWPPRPSWPAAPVLPGALAAVHPVAPCFSADHTSGPSCPCSMDATPAELAFLSASGSHGPGVNWMGWWDPGGLGDLAAGGVGVKAHPVPLELS